MAVGNVYGQLQAVLAKLGKDDDTRSVAGFVSGKQRNKISSSGSVVQSNEQSPGLKGKSKDMFESGNAQASAMQPLMVPQNVVLPS